MLKRESNNHHKMNLLFLIFVHISLTEIHEQLLATKLSPSVWAGGYEGKQAKHY